MEISVNQIPVCEICGEANETKLKLQTVYAKGYESLLHQCELLNSNDLKDRQKSKWNAGAVIKVHNECRAHFHLKRPDNGTEEVIQEPRSKTKRLVSCPSTSSGTVKKFYLDMFETRL